VSAEDDESALRRRLRQARRIVVKVGSALLSRPGAGLDLAAIARVSEQLNRLLDDGRQVLLVSSGAVAEGASRLGMRTMPGAIHQRQAAAAVGQMGLIQAWERAFAAHDRHTALVLLSHDDLADRRRYLNARSTLTTLLDLSVVPVINENDSVATDEIQFGDNDTLAALVTNLLQADLLVLLTDRDGLHRADPRQSPDAPLVSWAEAEDPQLDAMVQAPAGLTGRGGMLTKLRAARLAARSGADTVIAGGRHDGVLLRVLAGDGLGTLLTAGIRPLDARKRWIADQLRPRGTLVLDAGAVAALEERGVSLLPVGVTAVEGTFQRGDVVRCRSVDGRAVAQGLVNYSSGEAERLRGHASAEIAALVGYEGEPELVHRDNLVLLSSRHKPRGQD